MSNQETAQLRADYKYCENVIKKYSKSFYYAFSQLPDEKAKAVYAVYAFCREADDVVDETQEQTKKQQKLQQLEEELNQFAKGNTPDEPKWRALRDVFQRFEMEVEPFYLQITGQKSDIHFQQPQSIEDLYEYSYHVAGSVGLMLLPILCSKVTDGMKQSAVDLGIAMQLTNILRDVGEDFHEKDRIYLPKDWMEEKNYTAENIQKRVNNQQFKELWETIANEAEIRYERFTKIVKHFDADSRMPVAAAAEIYRHILQVIRENDYDCLTKKQYVPKKTKFLIYKRLKTDGIFTEN